MAPSCLHTIITVGAWFIANRPPSLYLPHLHIYYFHFISPAVSVMLDRQMMIRGTPAPTPFDHPDADIVLRSSDKEPVDFRAFKLLLSLASPFFSEIFTLPQPSSPLLYPDSGSLDGVPVIQMSEDKETLQILLGLCFPVSVHAHPRISSVQQLQKVAEAAIKFEMQGVQNHLKSEIVSPRFVEAQPLRVFAIAYRYGWDTEARKAARLTLRHPMNVPFVDELEFISAATYYRLQEYHRACGEVASSRVLLQPALADFDDPWVWLSCRRCPAAWDVRSSEYPSARRWWAEWIEDVSEEVRRRPWGETARKCDLLNKAVRQASACSNCSQSAKEDLDAFSLMLAVEVEKDISTVNIDIDFDDWSCASPTT
ncbi:unnamed protein product [Cyclocybe aegerita]|uniref:BTB domain-containing protein n=1 Tax=Cyclocybe aegerita TaxID=1973307 RepID=A0A8S0WL94_CYCAE|nr:unnamed protein product [Cyclocybe aegerita]